MGEQLTVAEVLDAAADLIEPEGAWAKGMYGMWRGATCFCAIGAIGVARGLEGPSQAEAWTQDHAKPFLRMGWKGLERFNDAKKRTQVEVVAKLREAAALAREQGK